MTRRELEVTDRDAIRSILDKCKILHLGLVDQGMPYVLAMNYGYELNDDRLTLYLHSSVKGYKLDVIRNNGLCCFEMECDVIPFSGDLPCQFGTAYSSLIGRGTIEIIENPEEKTKMMSLFMKTQTGQDFSFTERLVSVVTVLRITVDEYTAKCRPLPETKKTTGSTPNP
ncbi:MAG: pyridoxamine 5'-phosphate oxidase family protein [Clostridia bacterium]|nr:pyridoxamine 5'-phosphate oxidase family protein [Clostridia bacterium]